jgi:hypothetical protein
MGMEIGSVQIPGMDIGSVQSTAAVPIAVSGNFTLFEHGHIKETDNLNLFIHGQDTKVQGINLFIDGFETNTNTIELFVNGEDNKNQKLDLFVGGFTTENNDINLFISGPIQIADNINLFISSLNVFSNNVEFFIHGFDNLTDNLNLFISTQTPMSGLIDLFIRGYVTTLTNEIISEEYEYSLEQPISLIADFTSGINVTIELWKDGILQVIISNICNEIDNTGKYVWSLSNISTINKRQARYFWRMTDSLSNIIEGSFILKSIEGQDGKMPSSNNMDDYIIKI